MLHLKRRQVIFLQAGSWNPQKPKPRRSLNLTERLECVRPPPLPAFSLASCCSLISHFKNHHARKDVFPCMWVSLTSHSHQHVSHPPRLQICIWRTSGPSLRNIQGTEVVIWREEHTRKSGRPFCLLCDRFDVDRETVREINVSCTPRSSTRTVYTSIFVIFLFSCEKFLHCIS